MCYLVGVPMTKQFDNFSKSVLSRGVNAVLPRNLRDYWLGYLLEQANKLENNQDDVDLTSILGAVILILQAKKGLKKIKISDEELQKYASQYCTELQLEAVHRNTEFSVSAATVESIFSDRDVEITKKQFS